VILLDRGLVPASEGTYADNRWTRWVNENAPVRVTFVPVPRNGSHQAMLAMFAAGTAPDVIWEYNRGTLDRYYDQGVIQPVDDHIERYSTAYKNYIRSPENRDMIPWITGDDGKMYGMTSKRTLEQRLNQSVWVRKDWLDRFNMRPPTTLDEALAFMRRAKDENPSGLGTWGIGTDGNWKIITEAMFGRPGTAFNIVNGRHVDWYSTQGYRDALAYMQMAYREGLIDPEWITDSPNYTRQRQFMTTGRIAMRFTGMGFQNEYMDLMRNVPQADFVPIEPLRTSYGQFGFGLESPILKMCLMNKNARDPQAVMQYLDWLITDGGWTLSFGLEGQHYRLANGVPQIINADLNRVEVDYIKGNAEFALVDTVHLRWNMNWITGQAAQDASSQDWARRRAVAAQISQDIPGFGFGAFDPTLSIPAIANYNSAIGVGTTSPVYAIEIEVIIGRITVDEGLRRINDFRRNAGWDAATAARDAHFQANRSFFLN